MFGPQVLGRELAKMRVESLRADGGPRATTSRRLRRALGRVFVGTTRRPGAERADARAMRIGGDT